MLRACHPNNSIIYLEISILGVRDIEWHVDGLRGLGAPRMPVQIALCRREILTVHLLWRNIVSPHFSMKCCGGPLARCARLALAHLDRAPSTIVAQVRSTWVNDSPAKPEANSYAM